MPLIIESFEDAMEATALACGGKKAFACVLRPDLAEEPEKAHRWFLDALNSERRADFHRQHIVRACRKAREDGCHILKHWFDDATGYTRTGVAPVKTEYEQLAAEFQSLSARATEIAGRMGDIERNTLKAVK